MKTIFPMVTAIVLAGGLMAPSLCAQSLADVARREQAREKTVTVHGRTYTNADLPRSRRAADDASASSSAAAAAADTSELASGQPADSSVSGKATDKASADEGADANSPVHDREYWQKRMATAQATRDQAQVLLEAVQSRINALTADFAARDDPRQRAQLADQREKALTELDRLKKALGEATKGIADLEEEARRAGVPPGWLRG